jgi:hypothetical protein
MGKQRLAPSSINATDGGGDRVPDGGETDCRDLVRVQEMRFGAMGADSSTTPCVPTGRSADHEVSAMPP